MQESSTMKYDKMTKRELIKEVQKIKRNNRKMLSEIHILYSKLFSEQLRPRVTIIKYD